MVVPLGSDPVPGGIQQKANSQPVTVMNTTPTAFRNEPLPPWVVEHYPVLTTTQSFARTRPAWSVVTADEQTAGRGQRERVFISDQGGLYLTAVLPFDGDSAGWRGFALAVGCAVRHALTKGGVEDLRLRWPNDLMIGSRKVGGILVEQGLPHTLLVGIGLNVTNRPWLTFPGLRKVAGRLADHCPYPLGEPRQLLEPVLRAIQRAHEDFFARRLAGLAAEINGCWGERRRVSLEPVAGTSPRETEGVFAGIDERGQVLLAQPDGSICGVPEHHIKRMVEVE